MKCGWGGEGGGAVVDGGGGSGGLKKRPKIYCIYKIQYSFCITHSVGSVTKAKL